MTQNHIDCPGSRWWKFDLHTHSPASHDWKGDKMLPGYRQYLEAARDAGLDAVAVTDHNTAEGIETLQNLASQIDGAPVIFPGVEVTILGGEHLLLVFDPSATTVDVEHILSQVGITPGQRGKSDARASLDFKQVLDFGSSDYLCIAAHANVVDGILVKEGTRRMDVAMHQELAAVEVVPAPDHEAKTPNISPEKVADLLSPRQHAIPQIWCSDAHEPGTFGRRSTWLKMAQPNLDGLRLALLDGEASVRPERREAPQQPNRWARHRLRRLTVSKTKHLGQRQPFTADFSPWLTAIIGGRGTGKSTLVDLIRLATQTDKNLDRERLANIVTEMENRLRVRKSRGDLGLLEAGTVVELEYEKDNERFRLSSIGGGEQRSVQRWNGGTWEEEPAEGVTERFPVHVYSQKQLFELARHPNELLREVDRVREVGASERKQAAARCRAEYLRLRADARARRTEAEPLPQLRVQLQDVQRQIEQIEKAGFAEALQRSREGRAVEERRLALREEARAALKVLRADIERLSVLDLPGVQALAEDEGLQEVVRAHSQLQTQLRARREELLAVVSEAETDVENCVPGSAWETTLERIENERDDGLAHLRNQGVVGAEQFTELVERARVLRFSIAELEKKLDEAEGLEQEASGALQGYRDEGAKLTTARTRFVQEQAERVPGVQLEILARDDRTGLGQAVEHALGTDKFEADRKILINTILAGAGDGWVYGGLDRCVEDLRRILRDDTATLRGVTGRFLAAVRRSSTPEQLDHLALYAPTDGVRVTYAESPKGKKKSISTASPGQKTAALLAFVLGHGRDPIILDQPEDDLDTALIYELVVQRLREVKPDRQVVVVTHNPNIVVHGDAELAISLDVNKSGQTSAPVAGGLQEQRVRDEICRVMEGGREALELRYKRIMGPPSRRS